MGQQELTRNGNEFVQRVQSWGNKPEVARLRGQVAPARRADAYNIRCKVGQGNPFDVAVSVTADGSMLHLKNTTWKIDTYVEVATLISIGAFGQSDWITVSTKSGNLSLGRGRLTATLQALGLLPARS